MKRRQFVAGAGATTAIALAGCSLLGGDGGGGGGDSPEGVVESAYDAISSQDADSLESLLHSESPERPVEEGDFEGQDQVEINLQGTEVATEDPGEEAIRSEWGGSSGTYSQEELDTMVSIADGASDAAIVDAEVEITFSANDQEQTQTSTTPHLTATEDGDWTLVV